MRVTLLVLAILGVSATWRGAWADKVKTNQATKVYSRPGEHGSVLLKLKSGQNMTLLAKDGRWLKVRVQGRTGYVPRSKVDLPDGDDEIVRNTRRRPFVDGRSTKRGFGGASPDDRVGADATGDSSGGDDDDKSDKPDKPDKPDKSSKASKLRGDSSDAADDDDDKPSGKPTKKPTKASKPDKPDKPDKSSKSSSDDDDVKTSDDDEDSLTVVDDDKTGDAPEDKRATAHVTAKTAIYSDPNKNSDESFTAKPAMVLYPTDTKGKWTLVETDDGDVGWVQTDMLDIDSGGGGGGGKRTIALRAALGAMFVSQGMRTAGSTFNMPGQLNPDNYDVGTSAVSLGLGGGIRMPYGKKAIFGAALNYDFARATPGIHIPAVGGTGGGTNVGVTLHDVNLRGEIGYDLHKSNGLTPLFRLGYRYHAFLIDNVTNFMQNTAKLPSEVLQGPTIGAALAIPRLSDKIGLEFDLDAILFGAGIQQTKALEDGSKPSATAITLAGVFAYHWKKDMDLQGIYDLNYAAYNFGPPLMGSMRGHTGTDVTRTDIFHTVTFGIAKAF